MSLSGEVFDLRQISPFEAEILAGGGEMGAFMRSFDWSSSPLGPVAGWPQSLRTAVSLCLNARFASCIFWGPDLIMLYNDGCRQMIASKHPGALGHPGREGWPEIWHIIGPRLQSVLDTGQATWSEDFPLLLERNSYLEECYFTFSLSPIRDETGRVGGIFTLATETTEKVIGERRLRQETARREQELRAEAEAAQARVASILESITDGFFAVNYQWQFTYINQKAEQLLQKRRDEIFSKNLWEEFPEAVSSIFFEHCHKAASQRVAVEFEFEGFYPLLNIWFEVHVYPSHDGLSVYFHDITARKRAEEALKESEERYRDLFENANDLIQSVGPDGHFVYVNRAWREALRYTEAEISHLSFLDILSPKSHAHCIDIFQGVMAGEKVDKVEAVFVTKDGKEIAVEWSINCRVVNGKPTATRGIFRDITERKRAEAALQEVNAALRQSNEALRRSNEYLNQLAYAVSHDLQESLRMVIVYSQLLKKRYQGSLDGNADQFIADLVEGAQRMKMLLKDLLEYSRVANASEQPSAPVDCNAALQQALSNLGAAIKQSRATITSDHLPTVRANDTHLLQLFQNLVGNAIKYRSTAPPRMQVSAKQ